MLSELDPTLVAFVKKEEGFVAVALWDFKQWTNGYGTKAHFPHERITEAEAERRLAIELLAAQAAVLHFAGNLPAGIQNALTDLTYNSGSGWMHAGLGESIRNKNWTAAKEHLLEYDMAGGHVNRGLESRREAEASWFPATTIA